jgi:uncharacterized membrane protein SpoIIM required for sporulation
VRAALRLQSADFRREREPSWRRLEEVLERADRVGVRRLAGRDLVALPALHRAALSSLAVARTVSLDRNLLEYLESLGQRSYVSVYGVRRPVRHVVADFALRRFPRLVRRHRRHLLLALFATLLGLLAGWVLTAGDAERFYGFVDPGLAGDRGPESSTESLRAGLYDDGHEAGDLGFFASFLFTHNARVAMLVFSLGFLFGVPTFLLLFANGLVLGAFGALFASRGLGWEFWGWVLPHGVTEILAILLAGAAGFAVAEGLAFPGSLSRGRALAARGREAGVVVVGAVLMLVAAGLLEGFFRQIVMDPTARWGVAAASAVAWTLYFVRAGRSEAP